MMTALRPPPRSKGDFVSVFVLHYGKSSSPRAIPWIAPVVSLAPVTPRADTSCKIPSRRKLGDTAGDVTIRANGDLKAGAITSVSTSPPWPGGP
jgi:hypothetical protein